MSNVMYGYDESRGEYTRCRAKNPATCRYHSHSSDHPHVPMSKAVSFNESLAAQAATGKRNKLQRPAMPKGTTGGDDTVLRTVDSAILMKADEIATSALDGFRSWSPS